MTQQPRAGGWGERKHNLSADGKQGGNAQRSHAQLCVKPEVLRLGPLVIIESLLARPDSLASPILDLLSVRE